MLMAGEVEGELSDERQLVEVEILDARGLESLSHDEDVVLVCENLGERFYYEVSVHLVDAALGTALEGSPLVWHRLGDARRKSFMSQRHAGDRVVFGSVPPNLAVRFDVFKKAANQRETAGAKASPTSVLGTGCGSTPASYCRLIGAAEVIPWIILDEEPSKYVRWVKLVEDVDKLHGRDSLASATAQSSSSSGMLFSQRSQSSKSASTSKPSARQNHHKLIKLLGPELRVRVTTRRSTGDATKDAMLAADMIPRWFFAPALEAPNVVRVAVARCSSTEYFTPHGSSSHAVVAAKLASEDEDQFLVEDASPFFGPGITAPHQNAIQTTRKSSTGVWLQTLTLPIPRGRELLSSYYDHGSSLCVDVAMLDVVVAPNGRQSSERLFGRALIPVDNIDTDDWCWVELRQGLSLKLAFKLDYDETRDLNETRPYFDSERFLEETKDDGRSTNVARIAIARAVGLTGASRCTATVHLDSLGLNSPLPVMHRSTTSVPVHRDGTAVWNDCFEFAYPRQDTTEQIRVVLSAKEELFFEQRVVVEAPFGRVSRRWYDLPHHHGQLLVIATQYFDPSYKSDVDARKDVITEALSFAYPEVDLGSIERVFESTQGNVKETSMALGTMSLATRRKAGDANVEFLEYRDSNATDLSWAIEPEHDKLKAVEEDGEYFEVPDDLMSVYDDPRHRGGGVSPPGGGRGGGRGGETSSATGKTPIVLSKAEAIALMKLQPIHTLKVAMKRELVAPSYDGMEHGVEELTTLDDVEDDDKMAAGEKRALLVTLAPEDRRRPYGKSILRVRTNFSNVQQRPRSVARKLESSPLELTRIDVDVDRKPRDFITLRWGLTTKLGTNEIPDLPRWVTVALRLKPKAQQRSLAAGLTAASLSTAVAAITGVVPALAVSGGICVGAVACAGTMQTQKVITRTIVDRDIAKCTWLSDVVEAIANSSAPQFRKDDAAIFLKQFLAHGGRCLMYQGPKPKRAPKLSSLKSHHVIKTSSRSTASTLMADYNRATSERSVSKSEETSAAPASTASLNWHGRAFSDRSFKSDLSGSSSISTLHSTKPSD